MSVTEPIVVNPAQRTRFDAKYQPRNMRAEWTISPSAVRARAKHSYFPACIAVTIPSDQDGANSQSNMERTPDPDEIASGGSVPVATLHLNGLRTIHAA